MLVPSEKPSPNSSAEREEDACLADTVDNEVGQDLVNIGISHSSIDSSIDKITQDNHISTADDNDEVSLSFEMTQTGSESESDDVPLANRVCGINATGNNTHSALNRGRGCRGVRTRCGCGRGIRTCGGGHGVQANQTRTSRNGRSGVKIPLSIWRKVQPGDNIVLNDFVFAETDGVNMRMGLSATCIDFFDLYFSEEFWKFLWLK